MMIVIILTYYPSWYADYNIGMFCEKELIPNAQNPDIDYIMVINGRVYNSNIPIPSIPNLVVIYRDNIGFDFGGHAEALQYIDSIGKNYDYYFFMNSGVLGPFMRDHKTHWSSKFIERINDRVKLVGTRIICLDPSDSGGYGPKVGGFFFMTDAFGLRLLRESGTVFCNHTTKRDAIILGEYGLSNCIFQHGYSIDCVSNKENLDWRDEKNYTILHPSQFLTEDVDPYDVIFHKWFCPTYGFARKSK